MKLVITTRRRILRRAVHDVELRFDNGELFARTVQGYENMGDLDEAIATVKSQVPNAIVVEE